MYQDQKGAKPFAYISSGLHIKKFEIGARGKLIQADPLMLERGWDRYSSLQIMDKTKLAEPTLFLQSAYLKYYLKNGIFISLEGGTTQVLEEGLTEVGKDMTIDFSEKAWGSINLGITF